MASALFFGSPDAAVPSLRAVAGAVDVHGVVTRPPTRRGRGRTLRPTPVAEAAEDLGIEIHTPTTRVELGELPLDVDVAVVVAFGMLIPEPVLIRPRRGFVNVHFSLLPRWRGAAPVERAMLAGDEETGVCIMQMDVGLDTGPVFACEAMPIGERTAGELTEALAATGAQLLGSVLPSIIAGAVSAQPQRGDATHAPKLTRDEATIDLSLPASQILRHIRAFTPRPGASIPTREGPVKVWDAEVGMAALEVGEWRHEGGRVLVGTGDGALWLREVQAPGGRRLRAADWANGRRGTFPTVE
ncbi:MAG: methionyl-tRNA formyltransferase [Acidimicrobiia bacterium]|nr:methionyl-tRNA formyltransferase [Acidimicrobiia bacterium]